MNYLQEIVAFNEYISINSLSAGQISLWFVLMGVNNKCGWIDWFSVSNKVLESRSGLSKSGISKAREVLKEKGLINFRFKGESATEYHMIPITLFQNSNRGSNRGSSRDSSRDSSRGSNRDSNTLYKQDKTKQNKNNNIKKSPLNNYEDSNADDYYELEEEILRRMEEEDD